MRQVIYTNAQGRQYVFTRILALGGFDTAPTNDITVSSSGQDGASYEQTYLQPRELEITWDLVAGSPEELEQLKRSVFMRFSSKLGAGTLQYVSGVLDVSIPCVPASIATVHQGTRICTVRVLLRAYDPFFASSQPYSFALTFVNGLLIFPVTFPTMFGTYSNSGMITNDGDAPTPVIIRFYGGVTNPTFRKKTTGEYITLNRVFSTSEILEINTAFGVKSLAAIDEHGERTNVFGSLDPRSTLWSLGVGSNEIEFTADADNPDSYGELLYCKRYIGVY